MNYPAFWPLDNLTFEGLKALKLTVVFSCGTVDDPLDHFINLVAKDLEFYCFEFYFDRRLGQPHLSDEDSEENVQIEENSDEEIEVKETAD